MFKFLPEEYKKKVLTEYHLRVMMLWLLSGVVIILVGVCLLIPTHIHQQMTLNELNARKGQIISERSQNFSSTTISDLEKTGERIVLWKTYESPSVLGEILSVLASYNRPGVSISSIVFTPGKVGEERAGVIELTGKATTREIFTKYLRDMEAESRFEKVSYPSSLFVKQKDISFTLAIDIATTQ